MKFNLIFFIDRIKRIVFLFLFFISNSLFATHFLVTDISDPVVTNPLPNTLRWAIEQANISNGLDYIDFNVTGVPVPVEIMLHSQLIISSPVIIDGYTQPLYGFTTFEPKVTLSYPFQSSASDAVIKVDINGSGTTINEISFFRTGLSSLSLSPLNFLIQLDDASNNTIKNCVFGGIAQVAIEIKRNSDYNLITGNYFFINRGSSFGNTNTTFPLPAQYALAISCIAYSTSNLPDHNTVGGITTNEKNYFGNRAIVSIQSGVCNNIINFSFTTTQGIFLDVSHYANNNKQVPTIYPINVSTNGIIDEVKGLAQPGDLVELYFRDLINGQEFYTLVGRTTANNGNWEFLSLNIATTQASFVAYATSSSSGTSNANVSNAQIDPNCPICQVIDFDVPSLICKGSQVTFINKSFNCKTNPLVNFTYPNGISTPYYWKFENDPIQELGVHTFLNSGVFPVQLTYINYPLGNDHPILTCEENTLVKYITVIDDCSHDPCFECIGSFAPEKGDYILSAWVKQTNAVPTTTTYDQASILVDFFVSNGTAAPPTLSCTASGNIIDGWQKIEKEITVPDNATHIKISLNALPYSDCLFDDIRFQPKKSSMKSYVYDPVTLRLSAELDERNYATFYEYDEDGKMIRVKKETERGIMTIQENKNNTVKTKHD